MHSPGACIESAGFNKAIRYKVHMLGKKDPYVTRPENGMTSFEAFGYVAELSLPPVVADAF